MAVKKEEAGEALAKVTQPAETSGKPAAQSDAELNHRFSHVPPAGYTKPKFPSSN